MDSLLWNLRAPKYDRVSKENLKKAVKFQKVSTFKSFMIDLVYVAVVFLEFHKMIARWQRGATTQKLTAVSVKRWQPHYQHARIREPICEAFFFLIVKVSNHRTKVI